MADTNPKDTKTVFLYIIGTVVFLGVLGFVSTGKFPFANFSKENALNQNKVIDITIKDQVIKAEIADSDPERQTGLSNRKELLTDSGMLFVFNQQNIKPAFWMKDMNFAIDIIWINDGKVVQIDEANTEPGVADKSLRIYKPESEIDYVLEVAKSYASENDIQLGDEVDLSAL